MEVSPRTKRLFSALEDAYRDVGDSLPFHGWHHVYLTARKAVEFGRDLGADLELVEAAALTHDLNYIVERGSQAHAGRDLRMRFLLEAGFGNEEANRIDRIVLESETARRHADISLEAKALSDGDTFFKALPITQLILTRCYLHETGVSIAALAEEILSGQQRLLDSAIYFYSDAARRKYLQWASVNLQLWEHVRQALRDPDVQDFVRMLAAAGLMG